MDELKLMERLDSIISLLKPIAYVMSKQVAKMIEDDFLTTNERKRAYELFNGSRTLEQIASEVGVTKEAVRTLVSDLESEGLIEIRKRKGTKSLFPKRVY